MLLSIGMIVKNEERYLSRCLSALSPILQRVESELIIADTGSTDNTVAIAKQFTKDVFHFEWCDDFSAARNSTMRRAKGSWYLWIDADEILTDANGIIAFFNSGEYKQYNSAAITIRSGNDAELKKWIDLQAPRLIKLSSDSFFVNSIHEKYGRIYGPVKLLPVIANHYGYVTQDNEEFIRDKMENRNLKMVFAELDKNPSYCLMYIHASDIYLMLKDYEKALEYSEKGLLHAKEQNSPLEYTFLANTVKIYENMGSYAKAIITADEYFRSKEEKLSADLEVCYLKAESCFLLGRYSEAIKSYLNYFEEYKNGLYKVSNVFQHPVVCADEESYRTAIMRLARAYMEEGDFENAAAQLHSLPASNYQKSRDGVPYWLDTELKLMNKTGDYSGISALYGQLEAAARITFQSLIEIAYQASRDKILTGFKTQSKTDDAYLTLFDLRRDYYAGSLSNGSVHSFLADTEELKPLFADAAYFAVKLGLSVESIVQKIDASDIGMFFYTNSACHFDDLAYLVYDKYDEVIEGIEAQLWVSSLYFLELTSSRLREVYVPRLFKAYAKTVFAAMTVMFKDEMLTEKSAVLLPRQFRVGYYCHMAEAALEAGKKPEYIHYLRMALKQCPQLGKALKILAEPIQNIIDKEAEKQSEFEVYATKVKAAIKSLIIDGKHNEAVELMQQYESLCPDDTEIKSLRERLTHK